MSTPYSGQEMSQKILEESGGVDDGTDMNLLPTNLMNLEYGIFMHGGNLRNSIQF